MPTYLNLLPTFVLMLLVAACGGQPEPAETQPPEEASAEQAASSSATTAEATPAVMEDGVQVIEITVGPMGYRPRVVTLEQGVPARLVFTRTAGAGCNEQVQSEGLGIEPTTLPLNEPVVIEIVPDQAGSYTFACGMDMLDGTIIVEA